MADIPPTYEAATSKDVWPIVSNYVLFGDLPSACLVCRRWSKLYSAQLWTNPKFGYSSAVLDVSPEEVFMRFLNCLATARLSSRQLTRTVDIRNADPTYYEPDVYTRWLATLLVQLPNLESLLLYDFDLFDSETLTLAIRSAGEGAQGPKLLSSALPARRFGLKQLTISSCKNAIPEKLAKLLSIFPDLAYLDLSSTPAARHPSVIAKLRDHTALPALQVLKLKGLRLGIDDVRALAERVLHGICSLDLTDNMLPNELAEILLSYSFPPPGYDSMDPPPFGDQSNPVDYHRRWEEMDEESKFIEIRKAEKAVDPDLWSRRQGVSHLYVAGNLLTSKSHAALGKTGRLRVLHCGDVLPAEPTGTVFDFYGKPDRLMTQLRVDRKFLRHIGRIPRQLSSYAVSEARAVLDETYPHLRTLALTGVPVLDPDGTIFNELVVFLKGCAAVERQWAAKEWYQLQGSNVEPPQKGVYPLSRFYRRLDTLVLEMATSPSAMKMTTRDASTTKSVTEDLDSDNFLNESANDFSFFREDSEELDKLDSTNDFSFFDAEGGQRDKQLDARRNPSRNSNSISKKGNDVQREIFGRGTTDRPSGELADPDVIANLDAFRRDRKGAHDAAAMSGTAGAGTQMHWSGQVIVLWKSNAGLVPPAYVKARPGWTCRYI
ncbi:MAG: hypothetical protein M1837_006979 [Sclerophora amabilis]|nr:MAG: hypothetical protein M1837_006979 [Sclerophora amabilis]